MGREVLQALSETKLFEEVKVVRYRERAAIAQIVAYLAEIESRKCYREAGYPSLFVYCREALGYSKAGAYRRVQAAKVMLERPELYEKLRDGTLTLCAVAEIARVKEEEARVRLLKEAEGKGKIEVQRLVAPLLPPSKPKAKVTVRSVKTGEGLPLFAEVANQVQAREERYSLSVEVDNEFMRLYERAKELTGSTVSLKEVLHRSLKEYVSHREPKPLPLRARTTSIRLGP